MNRPNTPFKLTRHCAPSSLHVCDGTYLAMALVKQAEARLEGSYDLAITQMLFTLAGDALHLAAEASKSEVAAAEHRKDGDALYRRAMQHPVSVPETERYG